MDTVIRLAHPKDYEPSQGVRFEVSFTKARGFGGDDAQPFEARLVDGCRWEIRDIEKDILPDKVRTLANAGLTMREIAEETGKGLGTICRLCKKHGIKTRGYHERR